MTSALCKGHVLVLTLLSGASGTVEGTESPKRLQTVAKFGSGLLSS